MLAAALCAAVLAAAPAPLTEAALRARYAGLASVTADVAQTKEGRFWARPLTSRIRLAWTPERIRWETLSPVASVVTIEGDAVTVTDARGRERPLDGAARDPRVRAVVGVLRAFLALDLPRIEREFTVEYAGLELVARPRPDAATRIFSLVRFRFDEALELRALDLETEDERTHLAFDNVVVRRGAGPR